MKDMINLFFYFLTVISVSFVFPRDFLFSVTSPASDQIIPDNRELSVICIQSCHLNNLTVPDCVCQQVFDHMLKRMSYRRQKRWWNAYMLFYTRLDVEESILVKSINQLSLCKCFCQCYQFFKFYLIIQGLHVKTHTFFLDINYYQNSTNHQQKGIQMNWYH